MKPEEIEKGMEISDEELKESGWVGPYYATGNSLRYFTHKETGFQVAISCTTNKVIGSLQLSQSAVKPVEYEVGCGLM